MDSIERMRRINDLTKELKQHGFAESSFEAIKQANQIYGTDDVEDNVKDGMIKKSSHERIVKDENMADETAAYSERKLSKIQENVDTLTTKMNEIIRAINDLDARISDLKLKQDKLAKVQVTSSESRVEQRENVSNSSSSDTKPVESQTEHATSKQELSHQSQPRKDDYDANQRTGNFQSQDVAIDKMFYFGNKK